MSDLISPARPETDAQPRLREALGYHMLIELYDCPYDRLNDRELVEGAVRQAAEDAGVTIVEAVFHRFNPHGISGALVIAESHITVHTWPEKNYAAVDLFTCGQRPVLERAARNLVERFGARNHDLRLIERGLPA